MGRKLVRVRKPNGKTYLRRAPKKKESVKDEKEKSIIDLYREVVDPQKRAQ
jgi:hypothetical protein